ncbi:hypothetical protein ACFPU1_16315 [Thalassorhabdus alkalitolerans]|uniref:CopG family transcriptional regulator / antitoxin EndoAI n=1 Tax=Thalassorhabdus alkalitolerans TaxID=2282697 RepID=A0ABW0YQA1_9BACI|nr:antitoxin [Bacillus sp. FJAT-44742]
MSYLQQIAVELPEDIFSEIEHLSKEEIDSFFRKVIENQIEKKKSTDIRFQMKRGYLEMAQINLGIAEEFAQADEEALTIGEQAVLQEKGV